MNLDPIFRGLMRPPTVMGVPLMPFMVVIGGLALCYFNLSKLFIFAIPVAIVVMRLMMKRDEQIFDLIGVRLRTWRQCRSTQRLARHSVVLTPLR